ESYNYLLNKVSSMLAQFDSYHEVFDEGMQFSETAIEANLSENICDIYQDLKDFLLTFRIGTVELMMDALWECKNNFSEYWGQKLVNGLRALHSVRYGDVEIDEEEPKSNRNNSEEDLNVADNWVSKHFNNYLEGEDKTDNDV
nr:DUF5063 domain-containing protein [Prolixibacteraceae bacterium]